MSHKALLAILLRLLAITLAFAGIEARAGDKVRIVMRAFIPSSLTGSTDILPVPGSPGRFMLAGPLGTAFGSCFDTDNRVFSNDPGASSRIVTDFTVEVTDPPIVTPTNIADRFKAGPSAKLNCQTGALEASGIADVSSCSMGTPIRTDKEVQIITACSASNPVILAAPSIDYSGSFIYNLRKFTLSFEGNVGAFPSFEIYGSLNGGPFVQLLARNPDSGAGPFRLFDFWLHANTRRISVPPTKLSFK